MASPLCISASTRASFLPSLPPGCRLAKSSSWNPRFSERATANASPRASMVVVEAVGARPREQASLSTEQSRATFAASARVESLWDVARAPLPDGPLEIKSPVKLIRGTCRRLMVASSRRISSVSPLADRASTTSPRTTMPRSPCTASTGCMNRAGVPIELRVAAILRAMMPLLPMPVTTTRPRQASINWTALSKASAMGPASRSASARSASASMRTTFSPTCFMREEKEDVTKTRSGMPQAGRQPPACPRFPVVQAGKPPPSRGRARILSASEMIVNDVHLLAQSLRLEGAVPGTALPVVFPFLGARPRRQRQQQASRKSFAVGLIQQAQLEQLLVGGVIVVDAHATGGQGLAQLVQFSSGQPLGGVRVVQRIDDLSQIDRGMAGHGEGELGLLGSDAVNSGEHE